MLVLGILLLSIVPKFTVIYRRLKAPLPLPTKILLTGSEFLKSNILILVFLFTAFVIFTYFFLQFENVSFWWDRMKLRFPIYGPLLIQNIFAKFTKTLSVLLQSGMPIIKSIQISANSIGNKYLRYILEKSTINIQKGDSISQAFSKSQIFPDLLIQMVSSGEESGTLHVMLEKTSYYYQQQVNNSVSTLTSVIEPVLIIIIGILIAFIAVSIFLPIFKIGGAL